MIFGKVPSNKAYVLDIEVSSRYEGWRHARNDCEWERTVVKLQLQSIQKSPDTDV